MIRIVLADDHHRMREIWDFILSNTTQFEVVAKCANGQEAIDAAAQHAPDIVIMDINMQPVTGIEATRTIRRLYPDIKIIGMSIHADAVHIKQMLDAGASGYITKNTGYEEVLHAARQVHTGHFYLCEEVQRKVPELMASPR